MSSFLDLTLSSPRNRTTTPLSGGATWTGEIEFNQYAYVFATCKADVQGTMYFDFSDTGDFNGEESIFPVSGFDVDANVYELHSAFKGNRWFRPRFVNGSSAQSSFRLDVYYSYIPIQLNAPLNQGIAIDGDAILTRQMDPVLEISRGSFSDVLRVNKFGVNNDVGTATDPEDLWNTGGLWVPPTSAQTATLTFANAADDAAGTGAQEVTVFGLDENYNLASEALATTGNGTGTAVTTTTFSRVFRLQVTQAGTGGVNAGIITATSTSDATTQGTILAGYGQSLLGFYSIPAGYTGYLTDWYVDFYQATAGGTADVGLFFRVDIDTSTDYLNIKDFRRVSTSGLSGATREYKPYLRAPEKTDVFIRILAVSNNSSRFSGGFDLILVKD